MNSAQAAALYSLQAFTNSLLRDLGHLGIWQWDSLQLKILLDSNTATVTSTYIELPLHFRSLLGQHRFTGEIYLWEKGQKQILNLDKYFALMVEKLRGERNFLSLVQNSQETLQEILSFHAEKMLHWPADDLSLMDYIASEQSLFLGHPFHPFPKARVGFKPQEQQLYAAEFGQGFYLSWYAIAHDSLEQQTSARLQDKSPLQAVFCFDMGDSLGTQQMYDRLSQEGCLPFPMHPWQEQKILAQDFFQQMLKTGKAIKINKGRFLWQATSSLRSIFHPQAPYLLKFSLSLQLTNSIRHLQVKESVRGLQVDEVFHHANLQKFFKQYAHFKVLSEPAFAVLRNQQGECAVSSMVLFRENLAITTDSQLPQLLQLPQLNLQKTYLLATLVQDHPGTQSPLLHLVLAQICQQENCSREFATRQWFQQFLQKVLAPFLALACDEGLLLGAHLQNIIISLDKNYPDQVIFRDCQGTGFTELGYKLWSTEFSSIHENNGNVLNAQQVQRVFLYYLMVNTTFGTISALAHTDGKIELILVNMLRNFLIELQYNSVPAWKDQTLLEFLLQSPFVYQKENFRCSLEGLNENTMVDPLTLYNKIDNPMVTKLRSPRFYGNETLYSVKEEHSGRTLSVRPVNPDAPEDVDIFHRWNHQSYVAKFWELNKSKEDLRKELISLRQSSYKLPLFLSLDEVPIGYFEVYWAFDDRIAPYCAADLFDRGLHLLFGEEKYLRTRWILAGINCVCQFIFQEEPRTQRIWGEPRVDNNSIRKLGQALPGWEFVREFDFPHKRAALLCCERSDYFAQFISLTGANK